MYLLQKKYVCLNNQTCIPLAVNLKVNFSCYDIDDKLKVEIKSKKCYCEPPEVCFLFVFVTKKDHKSYGSAATSGI
jgi:hypothetical protein